MIATSRTFAIGSGEIVASGAGAKAAHLDRAAGGGIDVPAGFVVPDGAEIAIDQSDLSALGPLVAVRSAFSAEDSATTAMAGRFDTELDVPATVQAVTAAVVSVRESGAVVPDARRDVLVMRMVDAERAGVVFTEQQFEDDLVNVVHGLADSLVSGREAGDDTTLAKLRRFERPARSVEPWKARLAVLLREVRKTFGEGDWDIEWADDGDTSWLVQIRPITASPRRNEAFTIANHKEILPELPSVLMASVVEASAFDLMGYYRAIDPSLPVDRPFIESFAGRPYINLSQLTDLLRRLGLPTRLLADSLGGQPEQLVGLNPIRVAASAPALVKLGLAQLGAVRSARKAEATIAARASTRPSSFAEATSALRDVYVELVTQMSSLATAMTTPVALLRAAGTLEGHLATQRTPGTQMLDDLVPLAALASADEHRRTELEAGRVPTDDAFAAAWATWLEKHGHRGVFESDVARPRFAEDPTPILASILSTSSSARTSSNTGSQPVSNNQSARRSVMAAITWPLWVLARRPMAARERIRWSTMQAFSRHRADLLALAADAVADGRLPDVAAVWDLSIDELAGLDETGAVTAEAWMARRALIEERAEMRLPDLVHRFDDIDALVAGTAGGSGTAAAGSGDASTFRGVPLVSGVVEGRALRVNEPPSRLPQGYTPDTTVLVARSVDAGWVPIFSQVAGVAVEIGGDLSHGSIILRELGVVSVTNLGDLGSLASGERVRLDARSGRLERLEPEQTALESVTSNDEEVHDA